MGLIAERLLAESISAAEPAERLAAAAAREAPQLDVTMQESGCGSRVRVHVNVSNWTHVDAQANTCSALILSQRFPERSLERHLVAEIAALGFANGGAPYLLFLFALYEIGLQHIWKESFSGFYSNVRDERGPHNLQSGAYSAC